MIREQLRKYWKNSPRLRLAWRRMKKISFPGFYGVPVHDVIIMFRREIRNDAMSVRAAAICYNFILAIFPTSIFFFTLIPYLPIHDFRTTLFTFLNDAIPAEVFRAIEPTLNEIVSNPSRGLLSLNFFLALYFSTNGIMSMMRAFDKANPTFLKRNWFQKFWAALKINFLIVFQMILIVILIILSGDQINSILSWFGLSNELDSVILLIIRYVLVIVSFFNTIALIYYFAPAVKKKYRFFSIGATFATLLCLLTSTLFSVYINFVFESLNSLYGSLSFVILFLIWLYINALVLLFGFELNNSIAVNKSLTDKSDFWK